MYIGHIIYIFLTTIVFHVFLFIKKIKQKKIEKNNAMPNYKSLLSYGSSFSLKKKIIMHILSFLKRKKTYFLNIISSKNFKLLNGHKFN